MRDWESRIWGIFIMSVSLQTVARGLEKYTFDLLGVQEVIWDKGNTEGAEEYTFFYGKEIKSC